MTVTQVNFDCDTSELSVNNTFKTLFIIGAGEVLSIQDDDHIHDWLFGVLANHPIHSLTVGAMTLINFVPQHVDT